MISSLLLPVHITADSNDLFDNENQNLFWEQMYQWGYETRETKRKEEITLNEDEDHNIILEITTPKRFEEHLIFGLQVSDIIKHRSMSVQTGKRASENDGTVIHFVMVHRQMY